MKLEKILGTKVLGVRVTPLALKIVFIFVLLLLVSNFSSNYINLTLNRGELLKLMNQLLVKDLKELHIFAMNQYEIYFFNQDLEGTIEIITNNAKKQLNGLNSVAFGVNPEGKLLFFASKQDPVSRFIDNKALAFLKEKKNKNELEGTIEFTLFNKSYFGIFKYHPRWQYFIIRGEEKEEFYQETKKIFIRIAMIIVFLTLLCAILGVYLIQRILRFVQIITKEIMEMNKSNKLHLINLEGATPDEVTYLGTALNATSSTIDTLLKIFRKFVTKDVALRAYEEKQIKLEGSKKDLTILFSDIKRFTFITEALGNEIIKLLNTHYDNTFKPIHEHHGIIGSIIGDALLAVFGTYSLTENKSVEALISGYAIQDATKNLRSEMSKKREEILKEKGELTEIQEKVFHAVSLEVGVGIDGGEVFYGNIGSTSRMTNTVIGDNVNSSSRLEGLTRIYKVPIICSEYVKNDVETSTKDFKFYELDQVFVKGKTKGKKIYWPIKSEEIDSTLEEELYNFSKARELYYEGEWDKAREILKYLDLPMKDVFLNRLSSNKPDNWSGIWSMKTK